MRTIPIGILAATVLAGPLTAVFAGGRVCLEAEWCRDINPPMRVAESAGTAATPAPGFGAAGGKYLEVPEGACKPPATVKGDAQLDFTVVEPGDYTLWCRVYWLSACNSSFTMAIDDSLPFTFGKDATFNVWHWVKAPPRLKQLTLTPGRHVLSIRTRQDGVKIDQVLLVLDKRYVPVGVEETTPRP